MPGCQVWAQQAAITAWACVHTESCIGMNAEGALETETSGLHKASAMLLLQWQRVQALQLSVWASQLSSAGFPPIGLLQPTELCHQDLFSDL